MPTQQGRRGLHITTGRVFSPYRRVPPELGKLQSAARTRRGEPRRTTGRFSGGVTTQLSSWRARNQRPEGPCRTGDPLRSRLTEVGAEPAGISPLHDVPDKAQSTPDGAQSAP